MRERFSIIDKSTMTKRDFIALGVITLVYAVIAFARLGEMNAPQTPYSVVKEGTVTLDMGQDVTVAKLWDFLGYQNNPTYYIEYTSDPNGAWTTLCGEGSEWDAGSVFKWNEKDINVTARYFRISPSANNGEDSIMELVLTDADGNKLTPEGQVTIPIDIRKKLGLKNGDKVLFVEEAGRIYMINSSMDAFREAQMEFAGEADRVGLRDDEDVVNMIKELRKEGVVDR